MFEGYTTYSLDRKRATVAGIGATVVLFIWLLTCISTSVAFIWLGCPYAGEADDCFRATPIWHFIIATGVLFISPFIFAIFVVVALSLGIYRQRMLERNKDAAAWLPPDNSE